MKKKRFHSKKVLIAMLSVVLLISSFSQVAFAQTAEGEYELSASLSCYVTAMGGVEFGGPLLTKTQLLVDGSGSEKLKLTLSKSSVTIYSVTCDTFVDAAPSYVTDDRGVTSGTIGIYDKDGVLRTEGVTYTLSDDMALNASNEAVHYVDTITVPIDSRRDTYNLTLYINSNVMGVQFCNENDKATAATYTATLTVFWNSLSEGADGGTGSNGRNDSFQTQPETSAQNNSKNDVSEEKMSGLSIYRVDSDAETENDQTETVIVRELELNAEAFVIILIVSAVIFMAGAILFLTAKRSRKNDE